MCSTLATFYISGKNYKVLASPLKPTREKKPWTFVKKMLQDRWNSALVQWGLAVANHARIWAPAKVMAATVTHFCSWSFNYGLFVAKMNNEHRCGVAWKCCSSRLRQMNKAERWLGTRLTHWSANCDADGRRLGREGEMEGGWGINQRHLAARLCIWSRPLSLPIR